MSRSKSWTESQQPENQYTYSQYVVYVIVVGLVIVGLIALLINFVNWNEESKTYVVTVRSDVGAGKIRAVPFQTNDMNQLEQSIRDAKPEQLITCPTFDDKASVDSVQDATKDLSQIEEKDTMIVVCSAIGGVAANDDATPILRATNGNEILLEDFLTACISSSPAGNRIVILDCGHDFSIPDSYRKENGKSGDDFNKFANAVGTLLAKNSFDQPNNPFWVITSTSHGEIPLYSINQRRTLFSLAVENALRFDKSTDGNPSYQHVGQFFDALKAYCYEHGGEAAQTPILFKSGQGQVDSKNVESASRLISKLKYKNNTSPDEEAEKPDDTKIAQHEETKKSLEEIRKFWGEHDDVVAQYENNSLPLPASFVSQYWDDLILQIAEQSVAIRNGDIDRFSSINDLSRRVHTERARDIKSQFPGLVKTDPPVEITDSAMRDKTDVARAYMTFHNIKYRAKYYAAMFDSLSWLLDTKSLERLRGAITDLNGCLAKYSALFKDNIADLNKIDARSYRDATAQLADFDLSVIASLKSFCEINLDSLHGMTREMAITSLLDSPLTKMGLADSAEKTERRQLLKMLCEKHSGGERIYNKTRMANSGNRHKLYQDLLKTYKFREIDLALRKLDATAYYLNVGQSYLPELKVTPRTISYTAEARNIQRLRSNRNIIDLESNDIEPIDIGLKTEPTTRVDLDCRLEPADAPFVIYDNLKDQDVVSSNGIGKFEIKNSGGLISVFAKEDRESISTPLQDYWLTVRIKQPYQGDPFSNQPEFRIPLLLPRNNGVELLARLGGKPMKDLKPWPNQNVPLVLSLANKWHKGRTLKATLYACEKSVNDEIMPGAINQNVKDRTLRRLEQLPIIAQSAEIKIEPYNEEQASNSVEKIVWSKESLGTQRPFSQGLLCRVEDSANQEPWNFWLPVFPETHNYINFTPQQEANSLSLEYSISDDFEHLPINISWYLSSDRIKENIEITADGQVKVIDDLGKALRGPTKPILYVDVDNWPRRYAFVYNSPAYSVPTTDQRDDFPSATMSDVRLKQQKAPDAPPDFKKFDDISDASTATIFGQQPKNPEAIERTVFGNLEINCLISSERFSFPDSKDFVHVKFGENSKKYYFPWKVECSLGPDDAGLWMLRCNVSDYNEEFKVGGNKFVIDPIEFNYSDDRDPMDGKDQTKIVFDSNKPMGTSLMVRTPEVELPREGSTAKNYVFFEIADIEDQSGGVGCDEDLTNSVTCWVKKQFENSALPKEGGNPPELDKNPGQDWLAARVEAEEAGTYYLGVQIEDRLGNVRPLSIVSFKVVKPKPIAQAVRPKDLLPKTYTLAVEVYIGDDALKSTQNPTLVIEQGGKPMNIQPVRIGKTKTFEFKGLKRGQKYKVTGNYEKTSGVTYKVKGSITHEFEKDEENPKKTKKLYLTISG